jgi:hypothetical protein
VGHRLPSGAAARHQRAPKHGLSGRGRTLRRGGAAARRRSARPGNARVAARAGARPHLCGERRGPVEARAAGQAGPDCRA